MQKKRKHGELVQEEKLQSAGKRPQSVHHPADFTTAEEWMWHKEGLLLNELYVKGGSVITKTWNVKILSLKPSDDDDDGEFTSMEAVVRQNWLSESNTDFNDI